MLLTPRHIDLFSGIGGFALAAHWAGFATEVFCEQDEFCQKVLSRHWPAVPIVSDIRKFDGRAYAGADLLTGGFPCQPFSCAGKQRGDQDDRFLWPEMLRVIREAKPAWIVGENVSGIINMALDSVLSDLENEGYTTQAFVLPACAVNAPHKRDRVWIVAHAKVEGLQGMFATRDTSTHGCAPQYGEVMADAPSQPPRWTAKSRRQYGSGQFEPGMGDMAHGLPRRLDGHFDAEPAHIHRIATGISQRAAKLKALGNAIVPQVAYEILRCMREIECS